MEKEETFKVLEDGRIIIGDITIDPNRNVIEQLMSENVIEQLMSHHHSKWIVEFLVYGTGPLANKE